MTTRDEQFTDLEIAAIKETLYRAVLNCVGASELPADVAWTVLADVVSNAHGGAPASVRVALRLEDDPNQRLVVDAHSNGRIDKYVATVTGTVPDAAPEEVH